MMTDDEMRRDFRRAGLIGPEEHTTVTFDWSAWQRRRAKVVDARHGPRQWAWLAMVVVLFAGLVMVPTTLRPSMASHHNPRSPANMARVIALRLGDPFASHLHWHHTAAGWVIQGTSSNQNFYAGKTAAQQNSGWEYFTAHIGKHQTLVTLSSQGVGGAVVRLGPAPDFGSPVKVSWPSQDGPGAIGAWAARLAFFSGHPHAHATATLTNMTGAHLEAPLSTWLVGDPSAVLLSLRQGRWHVQYALSLGGGTPVPDAVRPAGYHWSWTVSSPSRPFALGHAAAKEILAWAQSRWGKAVTGYRDALVSSLWAPTGSKAVEVQFLSAYGPMPEPVFFSPQGKYLIWIVNEGFGRRALEPSDGGLPHATVMLANTFPPVTMLPYHRSYGVIPHTHHPYHVTTRLVLHTAVPNGTVRTLLMRSTHALTQVFFRSVKTATITKVALLNQSAHAVSARVWYTVTPGLWSGSMGRFRISLDWRKSHGRWKLVKTWGPASIKH